MKIDTEYKEIMERIAYLEDLLPSQEDAGVIRTDLEEPARNTAIAAVPIFRGVALKT
jgi:hypothetical protein